MSESPTPPALPKNAEPTFALGQIVGHSKQYKVERLLGRGGFGEVFLAYEARAHRRVAIKTMLPEHNHNKKLLRRFKAEYALGSALSHPSLVQMWDLSESPEGVHYIVMEYIDGTPLAHLMFTQEKAVGQYGLEACQHLAYQISSLFAQLHHRRIIHRDLKPGNIMVVKDPTIGGGQRYKLIDFGIAKLIDRDRAKSMDVEMNTTTGLALGTPMLMSPESIRGGKAQGPETDVYALGCMLYRAIAGNYPFDGQPSEVMMHHVRDEPLPLTADDPGLPHDIADLIHSMLAKDPAARPTMEQVSEFFARKLGLLSAAAQVVVKGTTLELQAVLSDLSTGAVSPTMSGMVSMEVVPSAQAVKTETASPARSSASRLALMLAIGVIVLLILGTVVLRKAAQRTESQAATIPLRAEQKQAVTPDLGASPAKSLPAPPPEKNTILPEPIATPNKKHKRKHGHLFQE